MTIIKAGAFLVLWIVTAGGLALCIGRILYLTHDGNNTRREATIYRDALRYIEGLKPCLDRTARDCAARALEDGAEIFREG